MTILHIEISLEAFDAVIFVLEKTKDTKVFFPKGKWATIQALREQRDKALRLSHEGKEMIKPPATVVNVRHDLPYDVYIGRPTIYGNPCYLKQGASLEERESCIAEFQTYFDERIANDKRFKAAVRTLRGLRLGCHCAPLPCHGDVYVKWLNENS